MKRLWGIVLFILSICTTNAQPTRQFILFGRDSLQALLASSQPDTNRVIILSELSVRYLLSSHDTAMKYAQEGLALARALKFRKGEADCLRRSGIVLFQQGRYPEALDIYQQALSISEDIDYPFGIGAGLGHIGNIYNVQGDFPKSRSYYSRHLKISEATHNEYEQVTALANLGRSHLQQGHLDSASVFLNQALKVMNTPGHFRLAIVWTDMGKLQAKMGNEAAAMAFFRKGISTATTANNFITLSEAYVGIADLYRKAQQPDSSIFYARQALKAGEQNTYAEGILAASQLLSEVYEPIDEHEAFKYHKMATAVKDSLFNTEKAAQVQNLFFVEHQRQQTLEAARVKYQNQLKLYALVAALCVFLILAIILWRNNRNRQRAYILLQNQKRETELQKQIAEQTLDELKSTQTQLIQKEKMASLGELTAGIAHEIQNPLNFVNNYSEVNVELLEELEAELETGNVSGARAIAVDLRDNESKIHHHGKRADAIVRGMLEHARSMPGERQPTDLNRLADEYLRLAYQGLRAKDSGFQCELITDYDQKLGAVEVVAPDIGRVLLNLYNNAFYAVQEKQKLAQRGYLPTVSVSTRRQNGQVEIRVWDNGTGIPDAVKGKIFQPFFTSKPTGQGTGLGLSLSYDIVTKGHGGSLRVESEQEQSTEFVVTLPSA